MAFRYIIGALMASLDASQIALSERKQRIKADLTLLGVSLIWGSAFVVQRIAALEVGVFYFNGLRFLLAALFLLPFARLGVLRQTDFQRTGNANWWGILLTGLALFCGSAFQQAGLQYTTAGNAGFITGLYVVLIPLFMALVWRQRPRPIIWLAALLAATGLFLLSTSGKMHLNPGDALVLVSAIFWALHVILVGQLVGHVDVMTLAIGQYLVCGLANLVAGLALEPNGFSGLVGFWWVVAYTGIISVGLGYTLQVVGQRVAPPSDAAIILSMEAVFAAFSGWLFLGETLMPSQILGCGIMLVGMLLAQLHREDRTKGLSL
jgi:drug/metabolite transporter (DMT)-like permease